MSHPTLTTWSRRRFLTRAGALVAAGALGMPAFTARGFGAAQPPGCPGLTPPQTTPASAPQVRRLAFWTRGYAVRWPRK